MDSSLQLVEATFAFVVICSESELITHDNSEKRHDDKLFFTSLDQATFIKMKERERIQALPDNSYLPNNLLCWDLCLIDTVVSFRQLS